MKDTSDITINMAKNMKDTSDITINMIKSK